VAGVLNTLQGWKWCLREGFRGGNVMGKPKRSTRIYVSYHTPDYEMARELTEMLKLRLPNSDIFFAPCKIDPGAVWQKRLDEEIKRADVMVFVAGEKIGKWQDEEYHEAQRLEKDRRNGKPLLIPLITTGKIPGKLAFFKRYNYISTQGMAVEDVVEIILKSILLALRGAEKGCASSVRG
jgi:hypothetical protein